VLHSYAGHHAHLEWSQLVIEIVPKQRDSEFLKGQLRQWPHSGGGQVADWCEVAKTVVVGEGCVIGDHAEVRGLVDLFDKSTIGDNARVFDSVRLSRSIIGGHSFVGGNVWMINSSVTDHAHVTGNAQLVGSNVMGHAVVNGEVRLIDAMVSDDARVYDNAAVNGCIVRQEATVCETAVLKGNFTVDKSMRIHEGVWTRPPKFVEGGQVQMTECIDGKIIIGCQCHALSWWREHAYAMGRLYNWSEVDVARFIELSKEFD
jgi:NDP-sugar pyrophosphorylase family protein